MHPTRSALPFALVLLVLGLGIPRAHAQSTEATLDDRIVSGGIAGLSFGLGMAALSVHLAGGDDYAMAAAISVSALSAVGVGTLASFVPESEEGAMAVVFPTVLGGAAVLVAGWIAMSGTMRDEEVILAVATPLMLGPALGIALSALLGTLDGPPAAGGLPSPEGLRLFVPLTGTF